MRKEMTRRRRRRHWRGRDLFQRRQERGSVKPPCLHGCPISCLLHYFPPVTAPMLQATEAVSSVVVSRIPEVMAFSLSLSLDMDSGFWRPCILL
ncbi:hypothetical protein BRADI_3g06483v3 [Brachypodium distachyon]|uniref:Uncharacterized protein n=1 Tax=Brachypodium distachyon TaxID=15368 RepID=A0A2K2CVK9_BRADI|nr:hypothetical protein BRADI_3g06483v3 [Brachypodium distachyon]